MLPLNLKTTFGEYFGSFRSSGISSREREREREMIYGGGGGGGGVVRFGDIHLGTTKVNLAWRCVTSGIHPGVPAIRKSWTSPAAQQQAC